MCECVIILHLHMAEVFARVRTCRFWPLVEESFKKLGLYFQYIEGADGLITLMQIMREKSLVDNSVLNARYGNLVMRACIGFVLPSHCLITWFPCQTSHGQIGRGRVQRVQLHSLALL